MLKDIKVNTELYLQLRHSNLLPEGKSWNDFHDELIQNASKDAIDILTDANPKDKCKYALFIDVDTDKKNCDLKDYVEIGAVEKWTHHLFWQGSGQSKSKDIRNTPHDYFEKGKFSIEKLLAPLEIILEDYCQIIEEVKNGRKKEKIFVKTRPLFWEKSTENDREWLEKVVSILKDNKDELNEKINNDKRFPTLKPGESVFIGITIDGKHLGEFELFRRYLLFVKTRAGIQNGPGRFKHRIASEVIEELNGICPSCQRKKPLLDQWPVPAELSFYQMTNESHSSYYNADTSSFRLCLSCSDLLFVFKQHLLEHLSRTLGGNECLILPSIKLLPSSHDDRMRLYNSIQDLWTNSKNDIAIAERGLIYRLGKLPSYVTVTFIFGDYVTTGKSQNVRRLDELNVIFPDVLPSRLSHISDVIQKSNDHLYKMWSLTKRNYDCKWHIKDDFYLLHQLFYPSWEENKNEMSRRRPEVERYLRTIFYGHEILCDEIAEDCFSNLISAIKRTRKPKENSNDRYAFNNYIGDLLSLFVFLELLQENKNLFENEVKLMSDKMQFEFTAMPELGKFVEMHPLFKDEQYLAPFFVGCLFSYAEQLQKENSRLAAYNWLGTMTLKYSDILQDVYPKVLNYITNKKKIVSSPRLLELMKAVAHFDNGKCDNDRVALVAFCHGWAVGRDFIFMKKDEPKTNAVTT